MHSIGVSNGSPFDPAVSRLDELLGDLRKAPSRPPSSPQALHRNTELLYGKGSDTGVRLLTVQDRRVAAQLYQAWRGMDLGAAGQAGVYAFRATATIFGATAPKPPPPGIGIDINAAADGDWPLNEYPFEDNQTSVLWLDAEYPGVAPGSWVVIVRLRKTGAPPHVISKVTIARITDVMTSARQDYGIAAKVTRLELDTGWLDSADTAGGLSTIRDTTVYLKAEELSLAGEPITDDEGAEVPVGGSDIELANLYRDLEPGRWAVVTAAGGEAARELAAHLAPRAEVADTVALRRRKGTLALLEELATRVASWPARAVEFGQLLGSAQPVRLWGPDDRTRARRLASADDSIFVSCMHVARRQHGCLRFCFVPVDSRVPRRYHCQPDTALRRAAGTDEERRLVRLRLRPRFVSLRYGTAAYGQLALSCPEEIARGAEDGSEMGAFHHLFQPQRTDLLRARLTEFTPASTDAGIVFVT
ncbi:MAG: hypothetical protein ABR608_14435 [Pseudonocardiaceae bacterium]